MLVSKQTHALHLRATQSISDCGNGWGFVLVRALAATWGSELTCNGSAVYYTLDWGNLQQGRSPSHVRPHAFLRGVSMFGCNVMTHNT